MMHPWVLWVSFVMHPNFCKLCQTKVFQVIITDPKHSWSGNNPGNSVRGTRVCWHISLQICVQLCFQYFPANHQFCLLQRVLLIHCVPFSSTSLLCVLTLRNLAYFSLRRKTVLFLSCSHDDSSVYNTNPSFTNVSLFLSQGPWVIMLMKALAANVIFPLLYKMPKSVRRPHSCGRLVPQFTALSMHCQRFGPCALCAQRACSMFSKSRYLQDGSGRRTVTCLACCILGQDPAGTGRIPLIYIHSAHVLPL